MGLVPSFILVCASFLISFSQACPSSQPWVQLFARVGDRHLWTLAIHTTSNGCRAVVSRPSENISRHKKALTKEECNKLRLYLPEAKLALQSPKPGKPWYASDIPRYELRISEFRATVSYRVPETCEILDDGNLKCEKENRSPAETLVFLLTEISSDMISESR